MAQLQHPPTGVAQQLADVRRLKSQGMCQTAHGCTNDLLVVLQDRARPQARARRLPSQRTLCQALAFIALHTAVRKSGEIRERTIRPGAATRTAVRPPAPRVGDVACPQEALPTFLREDVSPPVGQEHGVKHAIFGVAEH